MTTLRKGSSGAEVREAQRLLNLAGAGLNIDGNFGQKTYEAVKKYQKNNGLTADGVIGQKTWEKLRGSQDPIAILNEYLRDVEALPSFQRFMELINNE